MAKCITCGKGTMRPGTVLHEETIGGRAFAAELPASLCSECNEALVSQDAFEAFGLLAAKTLADSGAVTGEAYRRRRSRGGSAPNGPSIASRGSCSRRWCETRSRETIGRARSSGLFVTRRSSPRRSGSMSAYQSVWLAEGESTRDARDHAR
jgi:YgiT-type zinc finger domain-containing protein